MAEAKSVLLRLRNSLCINTCFPVMKVSQEVMFQPLLMYQIYILVCMIGCRHTESLGSSLLVYGLMSGFFFSIHSSRLRTFRLKNSAEPCSLFRLRNAVIFQSLSYSIIVYTNVHVYITIIYTCKIYIHTYLCCKPDFHFRKWVQLNVLQLQFVQ